MTGLILHIAGGALFILGAPLLVGVLNKLRALFQGRRGGPLTQPYRDLARNLKKEGQLPRGSTWLFALAPPVLAAVYAIALASLPLVSTAPLPLIGIDIIALVALLALARVILALAAMDTGTVFAGMGASREMSLSALAEPAMMLALFAVAVGQGTTELTAVSSAVAGLHFVDIGASHLLALAALFVAMLVETGRMPVDNPATHLELTMIHESMALEYSGWRLALIDLAAAMRVTVFIGLIISLFVPWGVATGAGAFGAAGAAALALALPLLFAKVLVLLLLIAIVEALFAKLRLLRAPDLIGVALMLAILSVAAIYVGLG